MAGGAGRRFVGRAERVRWPRNRSLRALLFALPPAKSGRASSRPLFLCNTAKDFFGRLKAFCFQVRCPGGAAFVPTQSSPFLQPKTPFPRAVGLGKPKRAVAGREPLTLGRVFRRGVPRLERFLSLVAQRLDRRREVVELLFPLAEVLSRWFGSCAVRAPLGEGVGALTSFRANGGA